MTLVAEESAKSKAAKEVIKALTAQVMFTWLGAQLLISLETHESILNSAIQAIFLAHKIVYFCGYQDSYMLIVF
jgi:hypothetical protein